MRSLVIKYCMSPARDFKIFSSFARSHVNFNSASLASFNECGSTSLRLKASHRQQSRHKEQNTLNDVGKGLVAVAALSFLRSNETEQSASHPRKLAEVDELHDTGREAEAYEKLKAAVADGGGQNPELLWRLAREARALANSAEISDQVRKEYIYEAFEMAQRGLQIDPSSSGCHKWMGILLDLTGRYEGTKKRIENSFLVKEHFLKAIESKPDDAVVLHCLGVWCFEVTDLPWYQQKLAAAFFAAPPSSSYDEALDFLLRAEAADPNFYSSNLLYIGKAYLRKGDKVNAKAYLQRAVDYDGDSHDDRQSKQEASQLLKNC